MTMTNGDKIRSMTDRRLAEFLLSEESKPCTHCQYNTDNIGCVGIDTICTHDHVTGVFKKWLLSEAPPVSAVLDADACGNCEFLDDDGMCFLGEPCPHL